MRHARDGAWITCAWIHRAFTPRVLRARQVRRLAYVRAINVPAMCLRADPAGVAVEHAVLRRVEHAAVLVAICGGCGIR